MVLLSHRMKSNGVSVCLSVCLSAGRSVCLCVCISSVDANILGKIFQLFARWSFGVGERTLKLIIESHWPVSGVCVCVCFSACVCVCVCVCVM